MLGYQEQYNILAGIYFTFRNKKANKRQLSVSHGKAKRDKAKLIFPYNRYEEYTRENFIISALYIMFIKKPSSFIAAMQELKELDKKDAMQFKNEIIYYRKFLMDDIERLRIEEGTGIALATIKSKYRKKEIKWFTFYFYVSVKGVEEALQQSRVDNYLYYSIKKLLLYITFSEKSKTQIKMLMQDTIDL